MHPGEEQGIHKDDEPRNRYYGLQFGYEEPAKHELLQRTEQDKPVEEVALLPPALATCVFQEFCKDIQCEPSEKRKERIRNGIVPKDVPLKPKCVLAPAPDDNDRYNAGSNDREGVESVPKRNDLEIPERDGEHEQYEQDAYCFNHAVSIA